MTTKHEPGTLTTVPGYEGVSWGDVDPDGPSTLPPEVERALANAEVTVRWLPSLRCPECGGRIAADTDPQHSLTGRHPFECVDGCGATWDKEGNPT